MPEWSNPLLLAWEFAHNYGSDFFLENEKRLLEQALAERWAELPASEQPVVLYLWQTAQSAVVLGLSGKAEEEVYVDTCLREGVSILRRRSGGGTVLHGPGNLCYSFLLPIAMHGALAQVDRSFVWISSWWIEILRSLGVPARFQGYSDIAVPCPGNGEALCKVSGNAQWRKRGYILQHGTLLLDFALEGISACLREPNKQPDYRGRRSHGDFLANLGELGITIDDLWRGLVEFVRKKWLNPANSFILDTKAVNRPQTRGEVRQGDWGFSRCSLMDLQKEIQSQDLAKWHLDA